ncbi:MAG: 3D domain-containing protein [Acidobacteria bacterium]|nr:3D domain-containing protein [Acidobacteriota bacterium]
MINVARGTVLLFLVALLVGINYFTPKVEAVTISASDSQEVVQEISSQDNNNKEILDNKDNYINKADNRIEKYDINVAVDNENVGEEAEAESMEAARAFKATAYCLRGKTASGRSVRRGIVAADTRVLGLGTRIHMSAGKYSGHYVVADTGSRIRGRILDIWVPSCSEAKKWGRRTVHVKVVSKRKK